MPEAVRAFWLAYGRRMEAALDALDARHAFFMTGCVAHCQTGSARTDPWSRGAYNGTSIGFTTVESAINAWYTQLLVVHQLQVDTSTLAAQCSSSGA